MEGILKGPDAGCIPSGNWKVEKILLLSATLKKPAFGEGRQNQAILARPGTNHEKSSTRAPVRAKKSGVQGRLSALLSCGESFFSRNSPRFERGR